MFIRISKPVTFIFSMFAVFVEILFGFGVGLVLRYGILLIGERDNFACSDRYIRANLTNLQICSLLVNVSFSEW